MAAAWDPELAERVGRCMGRDARARGVAFLLAPGVSIYRLPLNGRNFEYFGEGPSLASQTAAGFIKGVSGLETSHSNVILAILSNSSEEWRLPG